METMVMTWLVWTAAFACLMDVGAALGTNYEHDGVTTYCWAIPRFTNQTKLTEADRTPQFSGAANCPLVLTITLSNTTLYVNQPANVQWTVTAKFNGTNAINNTQLYFGRTKEGDQAQIVHSNVHSCVFGTGCDPFNDGVQLVDKTVNKVSNFTDNVAKYSDILTFPNEGEYSVLAHIILPNFNASSRFDYAVYTKLTVLGTTPAPVPIPVVVTPAPMEQSTSSSGLSQGSLIGIIVGCVVVVVAVGVAIVLVRHRNNSSSSRNDYTPAPMHDRGPSSVDCRGPKPSNALTNTNSTTGYESAWGGAHIPPQRPSHISLDHTNRTNRSRGSSRASAPRMNEQERHDMQYPKTIQYNPREDDPYSTGGSAATRRTGDQDGYSLDGSMPGMRKKRVDSDVEL